MRTKAHTVFLGRMYSAALLLCFGLTFLPYGLHPGHRHAEKHDTEHCAIQDPCHVSAFHARDNHLRHCHHKSHLRAELKGCHLCDLLNHHHSPYIRTFQTIVVNREVVGLAIFSRELSFVKQCTYRPGQRGPPALC